MTESWFGREKAKMAAPSLAEITTAAESADGPSIVSASHPALGGVDPLGLRQINFDLMDQVLPGLNNVARHIRPFVVVAWAWRRALQLAEKQDKDKIQVDLLEDFVDRIEVIYTWSLLLSDPTADLPGRQVVGSILHQQHFNFGGTAWRQRRDARQDSTAFTAAVNYGPGLKSFGWVEPHLTHASILVPTPAAKAALDAFEAAIVDRLNLPAFAKLGEVSVSAADVRRWAEAWSFETVTDAEQETFAEMLCGVSAPVARRSGIALMLQAASHVSDSDADRVDRIRSAMGGPPSNYHPSAEFEDASDRWRRVQLRQLFRLALEGCLGWIMRALDDGPKSTTTLAATFMADAQMEPRQSTARAWLNTSHLSGSGPVDLMNRLSAILNDPERVGLATAIVDALAFSLANATEPTEHFDRYDRLPLTHAKREAVAWENEPADQFARHVLEAWVLAQHVYWSVGRGLADARARGRQILRLKVVLDEGGWTLAPGVSSIFTPRPTPDRLETALSLADECGLH